MAWLEQKTNGVFHIGFRFGGQRHKKSLQTSDANTAQARLHRVKENIALVNIGIGRLKLPDDADVIMLHLFLQYVHPYVLDVLAAASWCVGGREVREPGLDELDPRRS